MIRNSSRMVDDEENDAKGVPFPYQLHMPPSAPATSALVVN